MPIKVQKELPARTVLESENIFIMDEDRAMRQDIRPLEILILNLMPLKEETETQLLRALSNTPLQVDCTFLMLSTHVSKNTSASHLNKFYITYDDIRKKKFDGMIITGAPVENLEFEEVNYWPEQDPCDVYHTYLLGRPGRPVLSLWNPEISDTEEAVRHL